jgi:hypothetical protein
MWMILSHCIEEALELYEQQQQQQQQQERPLQQQQMRAALSSTIAATGEHLMIQSPHSVISSSAWPKVKEQQFT